MRSWVSESITSYASIPDSLRGIKDTSISNPIFPFAAHSTDALVKPAAPKSCNPSTLPEATTSKHDSIKIFSKKGLPTWTVGLNSCSSSKVLEANPEAPWIPSFPVPDPTNKSKFPAGPEDDLTNSSILRTPIHIALTNGLPVYESEKYISPPMLGIPKQFP